jgi:hypothetical protein
MTNILYPRFLEDQQDYETAVNYWTGLFKSLMEEKSYSWQPYMKNQFGDGTPIRDGNPIFNAFVPETGRAVRIIQHPPAPKDSFIHWKNSTEWADGTPFTELVISLILTETTEAKAKAALREWFFDQGEPEKVEPIQGS